MNEDGIKIRHGAFETNPGSFETLIREWRDKGRPGRKPVFRHTRNVRPIPGDGLFGKGRHTGGMRTYRNLLVITNQPPVLGLRADQTEAVGGFFDIDGDYVETLIPINGCTGGRATVVGR